jgi:hypothetical protein
MVLVVLVLVRMFVLAAWHGANDGGVCRKFFETKCNGGYIWEPPHPAFGWSQMSQCRPKLEPFYLAPCGFWVPEKYFPDLDAPFCPNCGPDGEVSVSDAKWNRYGPTRVHGFCRSWWLDCKVYPCNKCKQRFPATHPDSVVWLPEAMKAMLQVDIGDKVCWCLLVHVLA